MKPPNFRLSIRDLIFAVMLVAASFGSFLAGREQGYDDGVRRPPNFSRVRAHAFAQDSCIRSRFELGAVYGAAKQVEAEDPGFLARRPAATAVPSKGDPYKDQTWTVTFNDPKSGRVASMMVQVDDSLMAEYESGPTP